MHAHSQSTIQEFVSDLPSANQGHSASTRRSTTSDQIALPSMIASRHQTGQVENGEARVYRVSTTLDEAKVR